MIELKKVTKVYYQGHKEVPAIRDLSLKIKKGEFVSIMGPSGSGKSTLLHLMGGLDRPTRGEIYFKNRAIHQLHDDELSYFRRREIGFIFQSFNLLPTLTALENVSLPLLLDGKSIRSTESRTKELLQLVGLGDRITHHPDELSGGEIQRVAIARALVVKPSLILADEPTGNLDSKTGGEILSLIREIQRKEGCTVAMVTHDEKAASVGDCLIRLRDGELEA